MFSKVCAPLSHVFKRKWPFKISRHFHFSAYFDHFIAQIIHHIGFQSVYITNSIIVTLL